MIRFACPHCDAVYDRSDAQAGTKFACHVCSRRLQVPVPSRIAASSSTATEEFGLSTAGEESSGSPPWLLLAIFAGVAVLVVLGCLLIVLAVKSSASSAERPQPTVAATSPTPTPPQPTPLPPPAPASPSNAPLAADELARQAHQLLRTHCYRCHGENGAAEGGLNFILDRDRLAARRKIVPGDPERSSVYKRIASGEMPPADERDRPSPAQTALLRRWIEAGAPAISVPNRPADAPATEAEILARLYADVQRLPERDRRFIRYFTLAHLANAGLGADELQTYRGGLAKLVNSLSWSKRIVNPHPIDPAGTLLRVDIRDYGWNDRVWKQVLASYPYGVLHNSNEAAMCFASAGDQLSYVKADWFVAAASRPPLYHAILQLPTTERQLEEQLHLDVRENVKQERVVRAGFNGSGISRNNRIIERHESPYGSYWRSHDFADNTGRRNLFAHPLGAEAGERGFAADGGEIIFSLPNGLHAFMLIDGHGKRLDKAPIAIVSDARRPDRAVENGISCMSCHARGLIPKADQVRPHVERNLAAFPRAEADLVLAVYPTAAKLSELFQQDNEQFRKAVEQTGCRLTATEPVAALVQQYERELDLRTAAAELGVRPDELARKLQASAMLTRTLGTLRVPEGTVQRQVFTDAFPELVRELTLGRYLKPL